MSPEDWQAWRHSRDQDRPYIRDVLGSVQSNERVLARFDACGASAWVQRLDGSPSTLRILCDKCRHRLCPACAREKAFIIQHNLEALATSAGNRLSMITFTIKHTTAPLRDQLVKLITCFREIRRLKFWTEAVKGAAWVIECKVGEDGLWHPHIHCLADTHYIQHQRLTSAWLAATGDSRVVDVRRISAANGARYIAKYAGKSTSAGALDRSRLQEFIIAYKGVRICSTLGSWRKCPLAEHPGDDDLLDSNGKKIPQIWHNIGPYAEIRKAALSGDAYHQETMRLLGFPLWESERPLTPGKGDDP